MQVTDTEDIKLPTIDSLNINSDDFDSSEFWKSRDETNQNICNEKLLEVSRNGPFAEFIQVLSSQQESPSTTHIIDLDIVDESGWSPLIHASFNGHYEIVNEILIYQENKYKQEFKEDKVEDPAILTNELKSKHYFKQFLCRKVKWNGSTALHLACARGHQQIVQLLITKMMTEYEIPAKDSIDAIDYDLATPLHCAVLGKHFNICQLLLDRGCITDKRDIRGKTPFDWAQQRGLNHYITLLQKYESDIPAKVVESIWEQQEQEQKSMESTFVPHPWIMETSPSTSLSPVSEPDNFDMQYNHNFIPYQQPAPYINYNHYNNMNQQSPAFQINYNHHVLNNNRQRAPRHIRFETQQRNGFETQSSQLPNRPLLKMSKSWNPECQAQETEPIDSSQTTQPNDTCSEVLFIPSKVEASKLDEKPITMGIPDKIIAAKEEVEEEVEEESKANSETDDNDPALDAMKFQNKYLEARCVSLEQEKQQIISQYQQQAATKNEKWIKREQDLMEQLNAKQKQIHDLRHTIRQMRHFLDSLPVRIREKFYRDTGNFSVEIYDQKMSEKKNEEAKKEILNDENDKENINPNIQDAKKCNNSEWRTVATKDLIMNESKQNNQYVDHVRKNEFNFSKVSRKTKQNKQKQLRSKQYYVNQRKYRYNKMSKYGIDNDTSWRRKDN